MMQNANEGSFLVFPRCDLITRVPIYKSCKRDITHFTPNDHLMTFHHLSMTRSVTRFVSKTKQTNKQINKQNKTKQKKKNNQSTLLAAFASALDFNSSSHVSVCPFNADV